ncbi:MAG: hypothetical protein LBQ20_08075 [Rhodanobacter sp.]|jgi:hypothetical protein|nr:hypothetical protein [Rhodanobacter sp.]
MYTVDFKRAWHGVFVLFFIMGCPAVFAASVTSALRFPILPKVHLLPISPHGGSNYLWYALGADCDREPYGIVPNYNDPAVRAQVRAQLADMFAAGMSRLSLGLFFAHGVSDGTAIDSNDPVQVAQAAQNVSDLLADVKAAGFRQILFRFFPIAAINPSDPNYDPSLVSEHFRLIAAIRPSLVDSGLNYLIDLSIESAPRDSNLPIISNPWKYPAHTQWSQGVRALWQSYFAAYGSADTIGFSFLTDDDPDKLRARVRHMRYVYEGHYPAIFAVDIYGDATANEADKFESFDSAMRKEDASNAMGWRDAPVIIAETFYDDPIAAENLQRAIVQTGRYVAYLTQWPIDRGASAGTGLCADGSVAPPFTWQVFGAYGF